MPSSARAWRCCARSSPASPACRRRVSSSDSARCTSRGNCGSVRAQSGASSRSVRTQPAPAHLLVHPALEDRLRRAAQVEVRVELAPEALDLQQRLLQQHELGLDLHAEAPRHLEQAHQQLAEVDLLQRPVEDRLAHRADRALELVDARLARHPARVDVRHRHAVVVAVEERHEVDREVVLVAVGERAHDPEVHAAVAPVAQHEDVARVHVGVEEAVAEDLREEDLARRRVRGAGCRCRSSRRRSTAFTGMPSMRCITITSRLHQSQ